MIAVELPYPATKNLPHGDHDKIFEPGSIKFIVGFSDSFSPGVLRCVELVGGINLNIDIPSLTLDWYPIQTVFSGKLTYIITTASFQLTWDHSTPRTGDFRSNTIPLRDDDSSDMDCSSTQFVWLM